MPRSPNLVTVVVPALIPFVLAGGALGQSIGTWTPELRRVNADYTPNAGSGAFVMGRNRDGKCINFSVLRPDGTRRVIPMADPTAVVINDQAGVPWVYVTGTSDWARNANFSIYKSCDLINWYPHATAFREANRTNQRSGPPTSPPSAADTLYIQPTSAPTGGDLLTLTAGNVTPRLTEMWAPQLYIDPLVPNRVVLAFTAKGWDSPVTIYSTPWTASHDGGYPTVYSASVTLAEFQKDYTVPKVYFGDSPDSVIQTYGYNSGGSTWVDGGAHIGQVVPTSALGYYTNGPAALFTVNQNPPFSYYSHIGVQNPRSWMALDNFVHFEPDGRPWMLYVYLYGFEGSRVGAYPMLSEGPSWFRQRCLDPLENPGSPMDMGNPTSSSNKLDFVQGVTNGTIWNGSYGNVCEGPAVFRRTATQSNQTWTYLLYSRNGTMSGAYGIYCRRTTGSLASLQITPWADPPEEPIVQSARRTMNDGVSFGHGEVFQFRGKHYLIFHVKETTVDGQHPLTNYGRRTTYIKELTFDEQTGTIKPLSCDQTDPKTDVNVFLTPYLGPGANMAPIEGGES
jgi:hypothetical protein